MVFNKTNKRAGIDEREQGVGILAIEHQGAALVGDIRRPMVREASQRFELCRRACAENNSIQRRDGEECSDTAFFALLNGTALSYA
jgi:hypothetical protein